jgi:hypothetical protein
MVISALEKDKRLILSKDTEFELIKVVNFYSRFVSRITLLIIK